MIIVHTPTLEDYIKVVEWAIDQGIIWASRSRHVHKDFWEVYRSKICIIIEDGKLLFCEKKHALNTYKTEILNIEQFTKEYTINWFRRKYDLK